MPGKRPVDSQRSKLYRAEDVLPEVSLNGRPPAKTDLAPVQAYVNRIVASKTWQKVCRRHRRPMPPLHVKVLDGRRRRRGGGGPYAIKMPRRTRHKSYVLHELAHTATCMARDCPAHGWRFCDAYLALVGVFMGAECRQQLEASFKANRVRFKPRKRVTLSQEQRDAARQRMLALHRRRQEENRGTAA